MTLRANRVRKVASSIAESPPPTTAMSWSRKKKPSQVAHVLTPMPSSSVLAGHAEVAGGGAHREDDGARVVGLVADGDRLDRAVQRHRVDVLHAQVGAEPQRLLAHLVHQLGAGDAVAEAGVVLHLGGGHQRATELGALEHQRLELGPRGVDRPRCSRPGRSR